MKLEITGTAVSKKGTVWIQAKLLEGETPPTGVVMDCVPAKDHEPKRPLPFGGEFEGDERN